MVAMTDRIGWGILGAGHIAGVFAADLALLPDEAELVAVGSRSKPKADEFAREYGFARGYGSYAELVADDDVDVVYIASVHSDHFESARLCLEAGKAVLIEKPLTVSEPRAAVMVSWARDRGLFLMEALWTRTNPLIRQAAELVAAGEIGDVKHINATFGFAFDGPDDHRLLDPDQAGGGVLDLGVYPVHLVDLFLGEPDQVIGYGNLAGTGVDSHAAALLAYHARDGRPAATATVACSLEANLPTRLEIFGSDGQVIIDEFIRPPEVAIRRGTDRDAKPEILINQWPGGGYGYQAQEVMRCLRTGETSSPMVPWESTLSSARTLDRWIAGIEVAQTPPRSPRQPAGLIPPIAPVPNEPEPTATETGIEAEQSAPTPAEPETVDTGPVEIETVETESAETGSAETESVEARSTES